MIPDFLIAAVGVICISITLYDFSITTFLPSQHGPLTALINHSVFRILFWIGGKKGRSPVLKYSGLAIIISILLAWVILLWLGVLLIFVSDPYSVLNGASKLPADFVEKFYYTGFTLSTLGVGDFVAGSDGWRVITAIAAYLGLITTTVSITFLVPVISSAGQKRTLSRYIESMGGTPERIVINSFNGEDFSNADSHLSAVTSMVLQYVQNQLTYPILHHMHNSSPNQNIVLRLASLDEALSIYLFHIPEDKQPSRMDLIVARRALSSYLSNMRYLGTADTSPPPPKVEDVKEATGVQMQDTRTRELEDNYEVLEKRRRLWLCNLRSDGWKWEDMQETQEDNDIDVPHTKIKLYA